MKSEIIKSLDGKKEKEWNDGDIDTLIDFYQENELLWNHTLQNYKDRNLKGAALSKLAGILVIHSLVEIKAQWHTLTTTFDREHKRVEGSKRTGSGTDSVYKSEWKYYERMFFMSHNKEVDESVSTINVFTDLEGYTVSRCSKNPIQEKCKRKREAEISDVKVELMKEAINVLRLPVGSSVEDDKSPVNKEINAFGKPVQETLMRFNDQQRLIAKKNINVLFEIEMGASIGGPSQYQPQNVGFGMQYRYNPMFTLPQSPFYSGQVPQSSPSFTTSLSSYEEEQICKYGWSMGHNQYLFGYIN